MKIREIDLQHTVLLRLIGKLDRNAMLRISRRTRYLFSMHHFKVILDLKKAQVNDVSLIFLADFLNEFKEKNGKISVVHGDNGQFRTIEIESGLSVNMWNGYKPVYH